MRFGEGGRLTWVAWIYAKPDCSRRESLVADRSSVYSQGIVRHDRARHLETGLAMTAHEVDEPAVVPAWKGTARFVFFVINFSLAILLFLSAIVAIAAAESFGSFCGGIMTIGPSGL